MQIQPIRYSAFLLALLVASSICVIDADAQSRRRRRPRRVNRPVVTNPVIAPPGSEQATGPDGEQIISTAEETSAEGAQTSETAPPKKSKARTQTADEEMQQTIHALSNQVDRLNDKLSQMQDSDRTLIDMERLTRAEQRAESLRIQQVEVESKLADLQSKVEQIEYFLKPENIERAAGYGTVHPEEARDTRRRQLENERSRAQAQIRILETSRQRLETAVRTADAEVDSLRRKIEMQQAQQDTSGSTRPETPRPANNRRP